MRAIQLFCVNKFTKMLTYILVADKFLVPNFTTYSTILEKKKNKKKTGDTNPWERLLS